MRVRGVVDWVGRRLVDVVVGVCGACGALTWLDEREPYGWLCEDCQRSQRDLEQEGGQRDGGTDLL